MSELPSGTVAFLFTDIEGSTRLWQEHPDAMQGALARHDELVRAAVAAHAGHLVKTTGDGAHAVFANASDAVDAAVALQVALAAEQWPLLEPLRSVSCTRECAPLATWARARNSPPCWTGASPSSSRSGDPNPQGCWSVRSRTAHLPTSATGHSAQGPEREPSTVSAPNSAKTQPTGSLPKGLR